MCNQCKEERTLSEFYTQNKKRSNGESYIYYRPDCKECTKGRSIKWWSEQDEETKKGINYRRSQKPKQFAAEKDRTRLKRESGYMKEYYYKNRDKFREYREDYKIKIHKISEQEWIKCKKHFNNSCAYCGMTLSEHRNKHNQDLHREHVDDEGKDDLSNCVPSCKVCNSSKHTKDFLDWYIAQEHYSKKRADKIFMWLEEDYKKYVELQ